MSAAGPWSGTLQVVCKACGRPSTLYYSPAPPYHEDQWWCPYRGCGSAHRVEMRGIIVAAVISSEPEVQEKKP